SYPLVFHGPSVASPKRAHCGLCASPTRRSSELAVWPFTAALPAVAMPEMVTPTAASLLLMMLSPAIGVVIAIVGAVSATVIACVAVRSEERRVGVGCATLLLVLLRDNVTLTNHTPPMHSVEVCTLLC